MEKLFLLNFEEENLDFNRGLSVYETYQYPEMKNHYLDPTRVPPRDEKYKLTIVWDLDQTLVSADGIEDDNPDCVYTKLVIRPYAEKVLHILRSQPEIEFIVWTAGTENHAKRVVNSLKSVSFDYVISRSILWYPIKDLNKLVSPSRTLDSIILIDDRMDVGEPHPENLLIIPPYYPDKCGPSDATMLYLANIIYKAYICYLGNERKIPFNSFLHSPLTEKCYDPKLNKYYYGIKCFKNLKELEKRIRDFNA